MPPPSGRGQFGIPRTQSAKKLGHRRSLTAGNESSSGGSHHSHHAHMPAHLPGGFISSLQLSTFSRHPSRYSISSNDSRSPVHSDYPHHQQHLPRNSDTGSVGSLSAFVGVESAKSSHAMIDRNGGGAGGGGGMHRRASTLGAFGEVVTAEDWGDHGLQKQKNEIASMSLKMMLDARKQHELYGDQGGAAGDADVGGSGRWSGAARAGGRRWQWLPSGPSWRYRLFRVFEAADEDEHEDEDEEDDENSGKQRNFRRLRLPSLVARATSVLVLAAIIVSCLGFVVESMPTFRTQLANGAIQTTQTFKTVEYVCISIFTIEYLCRLLCVSALPLRPPRGFIHGHGIGPEGSWAPRNRFGLPQWALKMKAWAFKPINMVDFVAIAPFYVELALAAGREAGQADGGGAELAVLRALRLVRVFRVFKLGKYSQSLQLMSRVMANSMHALYLLGFILFISAILFGALIYFAEQGEWNPNFAGCPVSAKILTNATGGEDGGSGTAEAGPGALQPVWPLRCGAFVRRNLVGSLEETPFTSIPASFWWVLVTTTTVGYGDMVPTSDVGRLVGILCMHFGVLTLALPLTIISAAYQVGLLRALAARCSLLAAFVCSVSAALEQRGTTCLFSRCELLTRSHAYLIVGLHHLRTYNRRSMRTRLQLSWQRPRRAGMRSRRRRRRRSSGHSKSGGRMARRFLRSCEHQRREEGLPVVTLLLIARPGRGFRRSPPPRLAPTQLWRRAWRRRWRRRCGARSRSKWWRRARHCSGRLRRLWRRQWTRR